MRRYRYEILVAFCLVLTTLAAFRPACGNGFVNYDDNVYVSENFYLDQGLTRQGLAWAFTTFHAGNWHPLTWLTYLAEHQFWGLDPRVYHTTNVVLHAANTLLLFLALRCLTGAVWRSALVAALFALHPLHVESVAWVAERKDVLCTCFGLLTLLAYAGYTEAPHWGRYLLVVLCFALGLLAKPMLVTLPCVLLLLDYWPLGRLRRGTGLGRSLGVLLGEKVPLLLLAAGCSIATWYAQSQWATISSWQQFPLGERLANAVVSYARYLGQMLWPEGLVVLYPHPGNTIPAWQVAGSLLVLAGVSALALGRARQQPYLLVGWLWYLGMLVPVIGLVQVGIQGWADRYTYLPLVGIFVMLAWGLTDLAEAWHGRKVLVPLAGLALGLCTLATERQISYWRSSTTLWWHTLEVTPDNLTAHHNLASALSTQGNGRQAIRHFQRVIQANPHYAVAAHNNLGAILLACGLLDEAVEHFTAALRAQPDFVEAHINLAIALVRQGKPAEAVPHLRRALALNPNHIKAAYSLGVTLARQGHWAEAVPLFRQVVAAHPAVASFHASLAQALYEQGQTGAALEEYQQALRLDPRWPEDANRRAWLGATHPDPQFRDGPGALVLARQVCQATGCRDGRFLDTLAAAYAEAGRFDDAVATLRQALARTAPGQDAPLRARLRLYESHQPFRDVVAEAPPVLGTELGP